MIQDELKTAFRWYNDIEKQNRHKSACAAVCDFKLITPLNSILPFIIGTTDALVTITSWKVFCADDDSEIDDITSQIGSRLSVVAAGNEDYIIYDGAAITGLILSCGNYYSVIETSSDTYYSELFYVMDIEDPAFVQSDFPLFTAWRFYDNQEKQNRYKSACAANCNFYLLSGSDSLLPFMFRKPSQSNVINSWVLRDLDGTCEHNLDTSSLQIAVFGAYDYVYYEGGDISDLPCGTFESILTINGIEYYSELINIIDAFSNNGDTFYILQENGDLILQETNYGLKQE